MQPQSPKTPNNNHIQNIYKPNKNIKIIINWKKKKKGRKVTNQFLVFIALLELLVPGLDGVATDHLSLLCCHFFLFLKDFLGNQTDKHTKRNAYTLFGCLFLLPINKQTKLSDLWKYGMDLSFVINLRCCHWGWGPRSRFSCKRRKGRSPAGC